MRSFSLLRELTYNKTDIIRICLVFINIYCLYSIRIQLFYLIKLLQTNKIFNAMAERFARDEAPLVIHPTEASIHEHFNNIIYRLNQRREEMIREFRERMEEKRATVTTHDNTLQQLIESKADLERRMKENPLQSLREKMTEDIDKEMKQLQVIEKETEVVFECDTRQLEQTISVLGQLIEREIISIPDYPAILQPSVSVGKEGTNMGELKSPRGVAVDEKSKLIYVANGGSGNGNISVFSITGEYIDRFCEGQFNRPHGIVMSGENIVFISDYGSNCVYKFQLPEFQLVTKVGKYGTGIGEFNSPCYLTITTHKSLLVADRYNNRIVVMDTDLKHKRFITHRAMTYPTDVKVNNNNKLYVLSTQGSPCLHVFSLTGEKIRSLIIRDNEGNAQLMVCHSFCFDKKENILMADCKAQNIKVFSQEEALLHTLGDTQDVDKTMKPYGIALTENNTIICTSFDTNFRLHIFNKCIK